MRTLLLIYILGSGLTLHAATGPTITGVGGASGFSGTGTPTIFGGLAGDTATGADQYTPANSCASVASATCAKKPLCPCNTQRIYNGLILTINLDNTQTAATPGTTTPTTTYGNAYVTATSTGGASTTPTNSGTTVSLVNSNNGGTSVSMYWSVLCSLAGASDCESITTSGASISLNIYSDSNNNGVDSADGYTTVTVKILKPDPDTFATYGGGNNQGIGTFTPYPGDSKIYIKDPQTTQDFPYLGYNSSIKGVRVFAATTNLTDANAASATTTRDLPVSDDGASLGKNIVDGLSNGTRYYFRLGMLDEAQNVVMYSPDPAVDQDAANDECKTPTGASVSSCKYSATPEKVEGLLPDDFNCFVATAAYGSFLEPKLVTFREFRRRVLLSTDLGRRINHLYYRYGPYAARFLTDKPTLRAVTRGALWPAYVLSWLSLRFGFANVVVAITLMLGLAYAMLRRETNSRA